MKHKLESRLLGADDTTIMAESEEELKSLLMKVKEESEKVGLNLNIQETKIMASGSITSWEIDGETVETVSDFIFWGSKITVDGDCSHEIKRLLLLGRKVMTNLVLVLVAYLCPTLCDPMDCSLPGSSVHGIFQARVLEWGVIAFSVMYPAYKFNKQSDNIQLLHNPFPIWYKSIVLCPVLTVAS